MPLYEVEVTEARYYAVTYLVRAENKNEAYMKARKGKRIDEWGDDLIDMDPDRLVDHETIKESVKSDNGVDECP